MCEFNNYITVYFGKNTEYNNGFEIDDYLERNEKRKDKKPYLIDQYNRFMKDVDLMDKLIMFIYE